MKNFIAGFLAALFAVGVLAAWSLKNICEERE